jgi:hypothetical protein
MSQARSTGDQSGGLVQIQNAVEINECQTHEKLQGIVLQRQDAATGNVHRQDVTARSQRLKRPAQAAARPIVDASTYRERYAIKRHLADAEQLTQQLMKLAGCPDALEMALCIKQLREKLQELWRLRKAREDEWAEVLNFVQGALTQAVAEQFTFEQASAVLAVIRNHLAMGAVADHQPKQVRTILRNAGLDPWAPLRLQEMKDNEEA